ncbi:MAG: ATP-binding protein, partial [Acidobacteriota bacterium]
LPRPLQRADAAPVPARFDADALVQIVHNLLDNAEKYSRDADDRRAVVRVDAPGGRPRMILADGGPGLPRPLQRRAFKPFARGAAPDGPAGLGLGLALVNALARAQDGRVTYCGGDAGGRDALPNDLPDGACFVLTLPPAHDARSHLARRRDADDGKHAAIVDRAAGG